MCLKRDVVLNKKSKQTHIKQQAKTNKHQTPSSRKTNLQTKMERKKRSKNKITTNEPSPVVESKANDQIAAGLKHRVASNETTNLNQNIVIDALGWGSM